MMASYPPLEAYRRDLARLGDRGTFGDHDGQWLGASLLLQRYVEAVPSERHDLGAKLARYLALEDELTVCSAGLQLAAEIERAGALNLAAGWLHLLERIVPEGRVLELGRVRAQRATVALKLDAKDAALELYGDVERLGESSAEPELTARAWIGFALLAHMRGNYPEARRWYQAAALVADDNGCFRQSYYAHQGLLICASVARDFDRAMVEGWRAFLSSREDPDREAEVLSNMAQVLQDSGNHRVALRGFAAAVARGKSVQVLLGAIGGAALAGAALGQSGVVAAAANRVKWLAPNAWSYPVATALLDLSDAYGLLGQTANSSDYRAQARVLAVTNSYHELIHRADEVKTQIEDHQTWVRFGSAAQQVVGGIESLYAPPDLCAVN